MGKDTEIQWCDSTVNPTTGCDGCELHVPGKGGPCYAGVLHEGRLAKTLPLLYAPVFTDVRLAPGRMAKAAAWSDLSGTDRPGKPWLNGMPRVIFVGDMGDIFSKGVPFEYLRDEVRAAASKQGRRHVWMWLTKQATRMAAFDAWLEAQGLDWPANVWAGTSVTASRNLRRVDALARVRAAVRFVSLEPLREAVSLRAYFPGVSLAIVGGESDQAPHEAHPFDLEWARETVRECRAAGAKAFVKQLGSRAIDAHNGLAGRSLRVAPDASSLVSCRLKDHHGGDWSEWPADLRVREFPQTEAR